MTDEPPHLGKRVKKSDTLQIRIPHDTKQEFVEACREDDIAVSDRIRGWIENFLAARQRPSETPSKGIVAMIPKPIWKHRYLAAGAVAIGTAALLALPSAANTTFRAMFDQLDANQDGQVTQAEFMRMTKKPLIDFGPTTLFPEAREEMIAYVKETLGKPPDPYLLPPQDRELREALERGERQVESLSDDELLSVIPIVNDKNHPPGLPLPTIEEELEMWEALQQELLNQFLNPKPSTGTGPKISETCGHYKISDAEFANPWMNSNDMDMLRMFKDGDRNEDGVVTFEEFQISQTETARLWFSGMDENDDGKLTMMDFRIAGERWVEFVKANPNLPTCMPVNAKPRWLPLDINQDGAVTFDEYLVAAQNLDPR